MKQFDLQGNEYDIQIKSMLDAIPKDIESCTIHFTEKDLLEGFREEALRHRKEIERLNNIINKIEEHFVFLKMNSTGGNKEFFEDILDFIKALKELKGSDRDITNKLDCNYGKVEKENK